MLIGQSEDLISGQIFFTKSGHPIEGARFGEVLKLWSVKLSA